MTKIIIKITAPALQKKQMWCLCMRLCFQAPQSKQTQKAHIFSCQARAKQLPISKALTGKGNQLV